MAAVSATGKVARLQLLDVTRGDAADRGLRPEEDEGEEEGIGHDQLRERFGLLVVLFNVGPIAFFVGLFLVAFEGAEHGYAVAAVGLVVTVAGLRIYRRTEARIDH